MVKPYRTITITQVGPSSEPLCKKIGRGVFNFNSILDYISNQIDTSIDEITIDLSQVGWVTMFDWWMFTCILHGQAAENPYMRILLDFVGDERGELINYRECADYIAGRISPRFPDAHYKDSYAVHRVLNFIKSLEGSSGFESVARGQIALSRVSSEEARRPGWYRRDPDIEKSIILPRTNVGTKEMCLTFARRNQIERWREAMATNRIPNAAVFQSEEFWRVLCHELARNVFEHAKGPGFIAGRVVLPVKGEMPFWCRDVYDEIELKQLMLTKSHGFVELCVSDVGVGIPETIESSYRRRFKERHKKDFPFEKVRHEDLLKFAFDELGTCKDDDHSWITDRHALGHMLFVIEKYGGVLSVCSNNAIIKYCAETGKLKRCTNQLGFEPQDSREVRTTIPGTHLQFLIPITPKNTSINEAQRQFNLPIPKSFHVDSQHPVGPLIPIRDKLEVLSMRIDGDDTVRFKEAIRALASDLLRGSCPRRQMLVFDFSEVDWVPAQFETFLYLMQNVFITRLVLFTQVSHEFAQLINSQEDEDRPTYLSDSMKEDIQKRSLDREFTDGRFLETYSSMGSLVLALGPDRGEYIFGVRNSDLRSSLLDLIHNEKLTINELCESHMLDEHVLSVVLNNASYLFSCDDDQRWSSIFIREPDRDDLEVQRLRAITEHFDNVAKQCNAWRGRRYEESALVNERFYLPSENAVYTEFFESSRILARERYVIEVAERLIYRIYRGIKALSYHGLNFDDIDILACSTTPTVMLAEAIHRAWPIDKTGKRPVVIDYGPSLFSGADPAHVLEKEGYAHRAIIIQDLIDGGTLSQKLAKLVENQGIEVLFVLSFIQFMEPDECSENKTKTFPCDAFWNNIHPKVGKPVHAMIGLRRPTKVPRASLQDWGMGKHIRDYVVDPRSLRPVELPSLRLEYGYIEERSLTKRDRYLKELDMDGGRCRLAAGHFIYGHRHFTVVVDVRGVLTGEIGQKIIRWIADLCCDCRDRNAPWEEKHGLEKFRGDVSAILLPLHSQIHYLIPGLQLELAQRGLRVPHFFLDATSFGGGVETYDIPYQLQNQIKKAAMDIKATMDGRRNEKEKLSRVKGKQLRLLFIDDAIFSGRTVQTVLESLSKHVRRYMEKEYGNKGNYPEPINWIRAFTVLNQLPSARSALWHRLSSCPASSNFRYDEYAPFIGVATFSAADCPACKKIEQIELLKHRIRDVGLTHATSWINNREEILTSITLEGPSFQKKPSSPLPLPIDVLAIPIGGASERYMPIHVDSAIWRFYELIYLSYPLDDILMCLQATRVAGNGHPAYRNEYARFRLAVYDWCVQNWHQVSLYHAEKMVLQELKAEIEGGESIFIDVICLLRSIIQYESVIDFVRWTIDSLAQRDADRNRVATESTLDLDTALTLLFLSLHRAELDKTGLLEYLGNKQALMPRKSSFLSILYFRLTRPSIADPGWALITIAETCLRGRIGDNAEESRTTDHELLGRIVDDTARMPDDSELRRRLEGSLYAFIAAIETLQPYFGYELLSTVLSAATNVRDWLKLPLPEALDDTESLVRLSNRMKDSLSWDRFTKSCHMSASEFKKYIQLRLKKLRGEPKDKNHNATYDEVEAEKLQFEENPYHFVDLDVYVDPVSDEWCIMTHIKCLIDCISNIALEPVKRIIPSGPSRIVIKPCLPERPQSLSIEVSTRFGSVDTALDIVEKSPKIGRNFDELRLFGVIITEPVPDPEFPTDGLRFSMIVPVGFKN